MPQFPRSATTNVHHRTRCPSCLGLGAAEQCVILQPTEVHGDLPEDRVHLISSDLVAHAVVVRVMVEWPREMQVSQGDVMH